MNNNITERIKKLLALAGNNPSKEEAQAAMMKAQALMAKYNLSQESFQDSPKNSEAISLDVPGGHSTQWKRILAKIIANNFKCDVLVKTGYGLTFIGLEQDLQICVSVYNYATDVLDKGMHKLRRTYRKQGLSTEGISGDYAQGFIQGIRDKFNEQVEENGWALVLVKPEAVISKVNEISSGKSSSVKSRLTQRGNAEIYAAGYKSGKSCGTPQAQLT